MNRAEQFAERSLLVQGGAAYPVFLILQDVDKSDQSRGQRGNVISQETELVPRPTLDYIKGDLVTKSGIVLKAGDVAIVLPGSMITIDQLKSQHLFIRLGVPPGELLRVVGHDRDDLDGFVMQFKLYARGFTNT